MEDHSITRKDYYTKYIDPNKSTKCLCCGKDLDFIDFGVGFYETCGRSCSFKLQALRNSKFLSDGGIKGARVRLARGDNLGAPLKKYIRDNPGHQCYAASKTSSANRCPKTSLFKFEKMLWDTNEFRHLGFVYGKSFPYKTANNGYYKPDFICKEKRIVIEIDGSIHCPDYDKKKDDFYTKYDYTVLRFTNEEVNNDVNKVVTQIQAVCNENS